MNETNVDEGVATRRNELLAAWQLWDVSPGSTDLARRMEVACQAVAADLGTTGTKLRVRLSVMRAKGISHFGAVDNL